MTSLKPVLTDLSSCAVGSMREYELSLGHSGSLWVTARDRQCNENPKRYSNVTDGIVSRGRMRLTADLGVDH